MRSIRQYVNYDEGRPVVVRISTGEALPEESKKRIRRLIVDTIGRPVRTLFKIGCNWISIDDSRSPRGILDMDVKAIARLVSEEASSVSIPAPVYTLDNSRRRQS